MSTNRYVALLRAVNVGGRSLSMEELRRVVGEAGHDDVTTYIQSGNVLFTADRAVPGQVAADLETRLAALLGAPVAVLLRSAADLAAVVAANPFEGADPKTLHVTFLAGGADPARAAGLRAPPETDDRWALAGREVYVSCPGGYGRTKLNNSFFERGLRVAATTRNWRTVQTLAARLADS